ncbi:MAG TPA: hypothetical protein DCG78_02785 [Anaerolineaceae bacterium]|nr:hypothetical protein [Anaerolineaceae bacterium]
MLQVVIYTAAGLQAETDRMQATLAGLVQKYPYRLNIVDISDNAFLATAYQGKLPCLEVGTITFSRQVGSGTLDDALAKTQMRDLESKSSKNNRKLRIANEQPKFSPWNRFSLWLSKYYLYVIIGFLIFVVGLAFLAPVLMEWGLPDAAQNLYTIYHPFCHQLAFRSLFLFGQQPFYPRELAGVEGMVSYSQASGLNESDMAAASTFLGNPEMGYKVALCQRDIAIQSSLLIFTLVFALAQQKIKPIPIYIWFIFGLLPIALDGCTQLLSQLGLQGLAWLTPHESAPWQRFLTGALFGFLSAWFILPILRESMLETRFALEKKAVLAQQSKEIEGLA